MAHACAAGTPPNQKFPKAVGVYPMAFESEEDVAKHLPRFIDSYNERHLHSALDYLNPNRLGEEHPRRPVKAAA